MLEQFGGRGAELPVDDAFLESFVGELAVLGRDMGCRQLLFTHQNQVLVCHFQDRRQLARLHGKGDLLDFGLAHVLANGRDQAARGRAVGVFGMLFGQVAELIRRRFGLGQQLFRLLTVADGDHPHLDFRTVLRFEFLCELCVRHLQLVGRQLPQSQGRPDDVAAVLFGSDVAFLLQHFEPAVFGQTEAGTDATDLLFDVVLRNANAALLASLQNQVLIDQTLQHGFGVAFQALLSQLLTGNRLTVHYGHDLGFLFIGRRGLLRSGFRFTGGLSRRWLCGCGRRAAADGWAPAGGDLGGAAADSRGAAIRQLVMRARNGRWASMRKRDITVPP